MSSFFLFLLCFLSLLCFSWAFPSGPPSDACEDSSPLHGDPQLMNAPPYTLTLDPPDSQYTPGQPITVTLAATGAINFRGFFLSAFTTAQGLRLGRLGTWDAAPGETITFLNSVCDLAPYNSFSGQNSIMISHNNRFEKARFQAVWTPPALSGLGEIQIQATVVNSPLSGFTRFSFYKLPNTILQETSSAIAPDVPAPFLVDSKSLNAQATGWFFLQWPAVNNGSSPLQFYTVNITQLSGSGSPASFLLTSPPVFSPAFNFTSALPGVQYSVTVQASNGAKISAFSAPVAVMTAPLSFTAPSPPSNVQQIPADSSAPAGTVILSFSSGSSASLQFIAYELQYRRVSVGGDFIVGAVSYSPSTTSLTVSNLPINERFEFRIAYRTAGLQVVYSSSQLVSTGGCLNDCSGRGTCFVSAGKAICHCNSDSFGIDCGKKASLPLTCDYSDGKHCMNFLIDLTSSTTNPLIYTRIRSKQRGWFAVMFGTGSDGMSGGRGYRFFVPTSNITAAVTTIDIAASGQIYPDESSPKSIDKDLNNFIAYNNGEYQEIQFWRPVYLDPTVFTPTDQYYNFLPFSNVLVSSWSYSANGDNGFAQHGVKTRGRFVIDYFASTIIKTPLIDRMKIYAILIPIGAILLFFGILFQFNFLSKNPLVYSLLNQRVANFPTIRKENTLASKAFNWFTLDFLSVAGDLLYVELLVIMIYIALIILFIGIGYNEFTTIIGGRPWKLIFGHLCAWHLPLTFFPVTKNSLLIPFLGLPFDRAIKYHRWLARLTLMWLLVHFFIQLQAMGSSIVTNMDETLYGNGTIFGFLTLMGILGMFSFAFEPIRRSMWELFWFTHCLLYPLVVLLSVYHYPFCGYFYIAPGGLLILDHALRLLQGAESNSCPQVAVHRGRGSKVTFLKVKKPRGFSYRGGQYTFLRIHNISRVETHPFSISSAPHSDYLTFHILAMGGNTFTQRLADYSERLLSQPHSTVPLSVSVEGAFGKFAFNPYGVRTLIMCCGGIGITPFFSLIQEILEKRFGSTRNQRASLLDRDELEEIHLFWTMRERSALETWNVNFVNRLHEAASNTTRSSAVRVYARYFITGDKPAMAVAAAASRDIEGGIEMNPLNNRPSVIFQLNLDKQREMGNSLSVAKEGAIGVEVPFEYNHPNFDRIFDNILKQHIAGTSSNSAALDMAPSIGVLSCGPERMVSSVQNAALQRNFQFHREKFLF